MPQSASLPTNGFAGLVVAAGRLLKHAPSRSHGNGEGTRPKGKALVSPREPIASVRRRHYTPERKGGRKPQANAPVD
jgi:hypothetical protein